MEGNGLQTIGWRTPDHDELLALIDRGMTQSDYIKVLDQIALAYKELTDAMAAAQSAKNAGRRRNPLDPLRDSVAIFRWLFFGQPSPWSNARVCLDHSLAAQSRLP